VEVVLRPKCYRTAGTQFVEKNKISTCFAILSNLASQTFANFFLQVTRLCAAPKPFDRAHPELSSPYNNLGNEFKALGDFAFRLWVSSLVLETPSVRVNYFFGVF